MTTFALARYRADRISIAVFGLPAGQVVVGMVAAAFMGVALAVQL